MIKKLGIAALACATFVLVGGSIGLNTAEIRMASDALYGEVPAHRCVAQRGYLCGMHEDAGLGLVETSDGGPERRYLYRYSSIGPAWEHVPPTQLNDAEVDAVFASRADLRHAASIKNASRGAELGFVVWGFAVAAWLVVALIDLIRKHYRAVGARLGQSAQKVQGLGRALGETATLHAETRKAELRARKAIAEARLTREEPDASVQDVRVTLRSEPSR